MKILVVCQNDPCGVAIGHRELLRAVGHDYRVAVHKAVSATDDLADWVWETRDGQQVGERGALVDFAHSCDVLQFCPGIGGGWAARATGQFMPTVGYQDPPCAHLLDVEWRWRDGHPKRLVAYFHGSVATWAWRKRYVEYYADWALATSTLDYATELGAVYLPPYVHGLPQAAPRQDGQQLVIAHTPTHPANCNTEDFMSLVRRFGWNGKRVQVEFATGRAHAEAIGAKQRAHACFDHLRGSFSVNTLEAASMGLVPLVGLKPEYCEAEPALELIPKVFDVPSLEKALDWLVDDAMNTRTLQKMARFWFEKNFDAAAVTKRLVKFYKGL